MSLIKNKESGNFYPITIEGTDWHCDWLWSSHKGCTFECSYCSSKRWYNRYHPTWCPTTIFKLDSETDGSGLHLKDRNFPEYAGVFVSPYNDIMTVPERDIKDILQICMKHAWDNKNKFTFQTKRPEDYFKYLDLIPEGSWLGTTLESNDYIDTFSKAPIPYDRHVSMVLLRNWIDIHIKFKLFVTIEPIMKQTTQVLSLNQMIKSIKPDLVFVGANTSNVQLPEPTPDEVMELVIDLSKITKVYLKSNLKRLVTPEFWGKWEVGLLDV